MTFQMVLQNWKSGFVLEYTLWQYLRDNYKELGFSHLLKKKKTKGGDFLMVWNNQEVVVEVEKEW